MCLNQLLEHAWEQRKLPPLPQLPVPQPWKINPRQVQFAAARILNRRQENKRRPVLAGPNPSIQRKPNWEPHQLALNGRSARNQDAALRTAEVPDEARFKIVPQTRRGRVPQSQRETQRRELNHWQWRRLPTRARCRGQGRSLFASDYRQTLI